MNRNVERSSNTILGISSTCDVVARATGRIQNWRRSTGEDRWKWEADLRREERLRERARIARELHDTVLQGFLGASMQLQYAVAQVPADSPSKPSLCHAARMVQRVIDEGRDAVRGLRSSATASMPLEQVLSTVREEFTPGGARVRIFVTGKPKSLQPEVHEQIYQIGREALVNAMRHSNATVIETEVEYLPRRLRVVVRDNGCGMDPEVVQRGRDRHWGLVGMRERAESIGARLRIWSRPKSGTEIEISVPSHLFADACATA